MRTPTHKLKAALGAIGVTAALALIPSVALGQASGGAAPPGQPSPTPPPAATPPPTTTPTAPPTCSSGGGALGGVSIQANGCGHGYVNPFKAGSWTVSRTDMGVDYMPNRREPVVAIGDAKILGSSMNSGWPGGGFIWYRLLNGDHAGDVIYVAEHLTNLVPARTRVRAGQFIATALPGSPWTEWGWATRHGDPRAYPCYHEGMETNSGKEMARFLRSLGAKTLRRPEPGPNEPVGRPC